MTFNCAMKCAFPTRRVSMTRLRGYQIHFKLMHVEMPFAKLENTFFRFRNGFENTKSPVVWAF